MNWKKLTRSALALVLVCCLVFNLVALPVSAAAGGLVAAEIVKVSTVSCNPYVVAGACLIALGVCVAAELGVFEELSARASLHMLDQKLTNSRDEVDVLQTVNAAGEKAFYVAGDILESVRGWLFDSGTVYSGTGVATNILSGQLVYSGGTALWGDYTYYYASQNCYVEQLYNLESLSDGSYILHLATGFFSSSKFTVTSKQGTTTSLVGQCQQMADGTWYQVLTGAYSVTAARVSEFLDRLVGFRQVSYDGWDTVYDFGFSIPRPIVSDFDLSIGNIPTFYIDGTSALEWAPEYANRQLRVINTGGGGDPDGSHDPDGPVSPHWKWYTALSLGAFAWLCTQTQQDQWTGVTPDEFPEYPTIQELEILDRPDIDGFPGIEVQPVGNPDVNPDGGEGTDPDDGDEDDPDEGTDPGDKPGPGVNPDPGTNPDPDPNPEPDPDPSPEPDPDPNPEPDPDPSPEPDPDPDPNPDPDPGDININDFTFPLKDFFPFCIPWDIYNMFTLFLTEPQAPHLEFDIEFPYMEEPWHLVIDLSAWDSVAQILRSLELIGFCVGLGLFTREKFLRG